MSSSNTSSVLLDSGIGGFNSAYPSSSHHSNMSPFTPFFPRGDTVESVIGMKNNSYINVIDLLKEIEHAYIYFSLYARRSLQLLLLNDSIYPIVVESLTVVWRPQTLPLSVSRVKTDSCKLFVHILLPKE